MKRLLLALTLAGPLAATQADAQANAMREYVYEELSRAERSAETRDFEDALKALRGIERTSDLSAYEKAQLYTTYGYVRYAQGEYAASIEAYARVLEQKPLPKALESGTLYTLAQLQFQVEDYAGAVDRLVAWLHGADAPGPQPWVLLGQAYYQLGRLRDAIPALERAVSIAEGKGLRVEETWYLLLRSFHYELEQYEEATRVQEVLVRTYPKRDYWTQLAALYGATGAERQQLAAYELAYLQGFLDREQDLVLFAQLLAQFGAPYRAAKVIETALADGTIEDTLDHQRLLSQAWSLAQEDRRAIDALTRATALAADGELDARLAASYLNLGEWDRAAEAARSALRRGVEHADDVRIVLGMALYEVGRSAEAKDAFRSAGASDEGRRTAAQWISYIESEESRQAQLELSLR